MAEEVQVYKKFLCQKIALDILRVYVDMNETFLALLHSEQLLSDDEYTVIEVRTSIKNAND